MSNNENENENELYEDPLEDECNINGINQKIGKTISLIIAVIIILVIIAILTYTLLELKEKSTTAIYTLSIFSSIGLLYIIYASRQNKRIGICEDVGLL